MFDTIEEIETINHPESLSKDEALDLFNDSCSVFDNCKPNGGLYDVTTHRAKHLERIYKYMNHEDHLAYRCI